MRNSASRLARAQRWEDYYRRDRPLLALTETAPFDRSEVVMEIAVLVVRPARAEACSDSGVLSRA